MKREDVEHLALLSRIKLTDTEAEELAGSITDILGYVSELNDIATEDAQKQVGPVHTVMREDGEGHEPGIYTEDILNAAPERKGQYIHVKKILGDAE